MRVGAIDCGTNSIRLLVADRDGENLTYLARRTEIVRLGQGVDVTGRIADEAMARTLLVAREYAQICREHNVDVLATDLPNLALETFARADATSVPAPAPAS